MTPSEPARGEVWDLNLDPTVGREQAGARPAVILSVNLFNQGPAELVVVIPITRTERRVRWHVEVALPEGGLAVVSHLHGPARFIYLLTLKAVDAGLGHAEVLRIFLRAP